MSGRKRKSLWDSKESEIPPEFSKHDARHGQGNHSSHRPKWSELEANNSLKSNNRSQWSSSESWQDNDGRRDSNDIPETRRAVGVAYSYSRSPGFNERGRQNHSPPSDVYWSQSSRYGRSRSSSRSKGRAGSRSRSRSRGRDRDMDKGRDVTRSWSRGRDRDLDKDRDTNWSRSSLYDHRREYNEMDDRKSESRVSSQICRDFAAGMCRRGDQCRFLHQDNLNPRDGGRPERERAERWSGRQETSEAFSADIERPRHHPIDKVSNYDRSNRSSSFDHDHRRHPHKNTNIPCRYFAMGRCHRDDCRFSHDHHGGGGEKERLQYDRYTLHTDDENKYRSSAKRGNANGVSDININEWSASDAGNTNYTDRTAKKHAYSRQDQDLKDENISWDGPKWSAELKDERAPWNGPKWSDVNVGVSDVARTSQWVDGDAGNLNFPEPPISEMKTERYGNSMDHMMQNRSQNVSDVANVDTFEPTGVTTFDRDAWVPAQGSHFQTVDGTPLQTYEKVIEGTSSQQLSNNLDHPLVSDTSYVQQNDMKRGNNDMSTDNFNAMNGVSISGNTIQLLVPDQSFNQNSGMLGSMQYHDTDQRNAIIVTPSKGHEIDLNRSDEQLFYQHPQEESKILCEESINNKQVFKSEVPQVDPGLLQNDMTSYQVATITNLSASLNEILSNGKQLPELYTALNTKNSNHLLTSLSCSASVNSPVALTVGQPNPTTLFQEKQVPIGDIIEPCKHDQSDKPYDDGKPNITEDANNNKPCELGESKPLDQFILSSTVGPDTSKLQKICSPVKESKGSPELKKLNLDMNLEAPENLTVKEKKRPEEEIPSSNANPEGGVREGNCGKDEKEMRLFKVALVEFVKEILKPTWKEGQMSREVHKSIVKKVVDKVTSTIQGAHVPKTQEKVDQYLACSKPKLTKLVQAYKERLAKT